MASEPCYIFSIHRLYSLLLSQNGENFDAVLCRTVQIQIPPIPTISDECNEDIPRICLLPLASLCVLFVVPFRIDMLLALSTVFYCQCCVCFFIMLHTVQTLCIFFRVGRNPFEFVQSVSKTFWFFTGKCLVWRKFPFLFSPAITLKELRRFLDSIAVALFGLNVL